MNTWESECGRVVLFNGDCREVMAAMEPESVDSIVCDPPYGLTFMGKDWDRGVPGVHFWEAALRVAKPGAHLLAFGGTRTFHRLTCAIEDAGWEIRDCVMWVYGSGFPKSLNLDGQWQGWGTALKPAWEPIIVARKPLVGTVAANVLAHGTGALNVDGCRIGALDGYAENAVTQGGDHFSVGSDAKTRGTTFSPHNLGRWPANLIHDGSAEVTALMPDEAGGGIVKPYKRVSNDYYSGSWPDSFGGGHDHGGSAARFFYCAKASKEDRDEGLEIEPQFRATLQGDSTPRNPRDGETRNGSFARNHHPTVKPTDLMRYLCRLVTPPDGVVLDPFAGSGSTGKAAIREGFNFIGIELDAHFIDIARRRIESELAQPDMFVEQARAEVVQETLAL